MEYIQIDEQVLEIFTKALCRQSFVKFMDKLGLLPNPFVVRGSVKLVATRKVFLHACVLACRRLKLRSQLYLIIFPKFTLKNN